jgi:hypothetical protein
MYHNSLLEMFPLSNFKQATLKVKITSFSFNTNRKSDFHGLLTARQILDGR